VFNQYNFFIEIYYWTCITTNYVIYSLHDATETNSATPYPYFSLGVNGDGYYYIEFRTLDNGTPTRYQEVTTTLQPADGWNYVAFYVDEVYEYSYVYMYSRNEGTAATTTTSTPNAYYQDKYETMFEGEYDEGLDEVP
jgi:hypothetical protein